MQRKDVFCIRLQRRIKVGKERGGALGVRHNKEQGEKESPGHGPRRR
jgi:hypothetical protein